MAHFIEGIVLASLEHPRARDLRGKKIVRALPHHFIFCALRNASIPSSLIKNVRQRQTFYFPRGERGIRTPGPLTVNGFQDRRNRPLCHLSGCKIIVYPPNFKINYYPPLNLTPLWVLYIQKGTPKSAFFAAFE